jgi:hypothetical protein
LINGIVTGKQLYWPGVTTTNLHDVLLVPQQFASISLAIESIVRPSTIMLSPGVYFEDLSLVRLPDLVITTSNFLRRGVIIVGAAAASVITIDSASVYLTGLEIRSNSRARAISAVDSSIALQECVLAGNKTEHSGAGMLCVRSSVRVQKTIVAGNTAAGFERASGGGLHLTDCKVEIAGSTVQANAAHGSIEATGGGIYFERSKMRIWRSRVTDNAVWGGRAKGGGVYLRDSHGQIGGSVITGNGANGEDTQGGGIFINGTEEIIVHPNTIVRRNYPDDCVGG